MYIYTYIYIYMYIYIYILYIHAIVKTILCRHCYHHSGFVTTHALSVVVFNISI